MLLLKLFIRRLPNVLLYMFCQLLAFELQRIGKFFKERTLAKTITSLLFVLVFFFVGSTLYFFFWAAFKYISIEAVIDIRHALTLFMYEALLLALLFLGIVSAAISLLFNLFKGGSNTWIISSPSYNVFPKLLFVRSVATSFVPLFVVFLPAMLAFVKVNKISLVALPSIILSLLLFIVTVNALTFIFIITLSTLYYKVLKHFYLTTTLPGIVTLFVLFVIGVTVTVWKSVASLDFVTLFKADTYTDILPTVMVSKEFFFLPTHPLALHITSWQTGNTQSMVLSFLTLALLTVTSLFLMLKISPRFFQLWKVLQEGRGRSTKVNSSLFSSYTFSGSQNSILFKKEMLVFSRDMRGLLWFLFLLFIWVLQIGANLVIGNNIGRYQPDLISKIAILQTIQFIIAIYFISSFTLRFPFPSFSVEKRTGWIFGTAPLNMRIIFLGKYIFYTTFFVAIGFLMSNLNSIVLSLTAIQATATTTLLVVSTLFIVTVGLCAGFIWKSKESDDPETVTTSMPGLFFTAFSLLYGAVGAYTLYLFTKDGAVPHISFFLFGSLTLGSALLLFVIRKITKVKFLEA